MSEEQVEFDQEPDIDSELNAMAAAAPSVKRSQGRELSKLRSQMSIKALTCAVILVVLGLLTLAGGVLRICLGGTEDSISAVAMLVVGVAYIGLGIWASWRPLVPAIIAAGFYALAILLVALDDPRKLFSASQVLVLLLGLALATALQHRSLHTRYERERQRAAA